MKPQYLIALAIALLISTGYADDHKRDGDRFDRKEFRGERDRWADKEAKFHEDLDDEDFEDDEDFDDKDFDEDDFDGDEYDDEEFEIDEKEFKAFFKKNLIHSAPLLEAWKKQVNKREAAHRMEEFEMAYLDFQMLTREEPEMAKTELKMFDAELAADILGEEIRRLRKSGKPDKTTIAKTEEKLGKIVTALFDLRHTQMEQEMGMLQNEVNELQQVLKQRTANKAAIIKRHIDMLSGKPDPLAF